MKNASKAAAFIPRIDKTFGKKETRELEPVLNKTRLHFPLFIYCCCQGQFYIDERDLIDQSYSLYAHILNIQS